MKASKSKDGNPNKPAIPPRIKIYDKEYISVDEFSELKGLTPDKTVEMIRAGVYQGRKLNHQWFVAYSEIKNLFENTSGSDQFNTKRAPGLGNFFTRLSNGDLGLAKTFWLFGLTVMAWVFFYDFLDSSVHLDGISYGILLTMLALVPFFLAFEIAVLFGIRRASKKFTGLYILSVCTQITVPFGWFLVICIFFFWIPMLAMVAPELFEIIILFWTLMALVLLLFAHSPGWLFSISFFLFWTLMAILLFWTLMALIQSLS